MLFCTGCWFFSTDPPTVVPIEVKPHEELPKTDEQLFDFANERNAENSSIRELETAISAYDELLGRLESNPARTIDVIDVKWRLCKAYFLAGEKAQDASEKMRWIVQGEEVADAVIVEWPDRVEGYYYSALLKGRQAKPKAISRNGTREMNGI